MRTSIPDALLMNGRACVRAVIHPAFNLIFKGAWLIERNLGIISN
jgi:hypothetical protein